MICFRPTSFLSVSLLLSSLGAVSSACAEVETQLPASGMRTDSAGVAVWTIPADDAGAPLRLESAGRLLPPDSGWVARADGIGVDPGAERIYVLDEDGPRILTFGFDGAFEGMVGREGEGPGEYVAPLGLSVDVDGSLHVIDPGSGRLHTWTRDGAFAGSDEITVGYWGPGFEMLPDGPVYPSTGDVTDGRTTDALVRVAPTGVDTLRVLDIRWTTLDMPCGRMPVPEVFYRSNVWAARADLDLVAVAAPPAYRVDLLEAGRPATIFRRATPPRRMSESEAVASIPGGPVRFLVEGCGMKPAAVVDGVGYVEEVSPFFALSIDPLGRVWVARGLQPDVQRIDILDPDRGYVGSLDEPAFPVAFLDDSRFVTIVEGAWGSRLEIRRIVTTSARHARDQAVLADPVGQQQTVPVRRGADVGEATGHVVFDDEGLGPRSAPADGLRAAARDR